MSRRAATVVVGVGVIAAALAVAGGSGEMAPARAVSVAAVTLAGLFLFLMDSTLAVGCTGGRLWKRQFGFRLWSCANEDVVGVWIDGDDESTSDREAVLVTSILEIFSRVTGKRIGRLDDNTFRLADMVRLMEIVAANAANPVAA
jgi:hypothetical protein